ncbi:MAG: endonuclease/exonuclease/phosphatase family protein [Myxococcota bacterium]
MRLGTFNVWGLPEAFSDDVSSRMRALASRLDGLPLDLLLIQEAWTEDVRQTITQAALKAGFEVAAGPDSSGGLMTLSRLPIRWSRFERFRFRGDPERVVQGEYIGGKGFQTLEVEGPDGPFFVINTHVHARYRRRRPQLNSAVRMAQLLQVVGALHRLPGTALVGGDFNCTSSDTEYEVWRALTHTEELAYGASHETLSNRNFYKRARSGPDKRIDFLFIRPGHDVAFRRQDAGLLFAEAPRIRNRDRSFSDHFGFAAEVDWASTKAGMETPFAPGGVGRDLDPVAFERAHALLEVGMEEADRRERAHFTSAGGWAFAALLAAGFRRHPSLHRRAFLRGATSGAALAALAPAVGFGALARVDSDVKRDAFEDARSILVQMETGTKGRQRA